MGPVEETQMSICEEWAEYRKEPGDWSTLFSAARNGGQLRNGGHAHAEGERRRSVG